MPFVAVTTITNNAEIQAIIDGMRDELAKRGRWPGDTITIEIADAEADTARAAEQVRAFVRRGAEVLVAISEPSIKAAAAANSRLPLVVAGVSLETAEAHKRSRRRRTVTGIVSGDTHNEQFELIRNLAPKTKTVAVPVDPIDGNIQARLRNLTAAARRQGLTIMALPISVLQNAVSNRISELDPGTSVILLDRGLLPAAPVEALAAAAETRKLPLFATDEDSVIRGALAAMVVEPFGIGVQLGNLVARILDEPAASRAPFERARASHLVVNQDARARVDIAALERGATFNRGLGRYCRAAAADQAECARSTAPAGCGPGDRCANASCQARATVTLITATPNRHDPALHREPPCVARNMLLLNRR